MQSELDPFLTSAHSSAFSETIFPLWRWSVGSYVCLPLESPQFHSLRTLGEAGKGSGEVVDGVHACAVQEQLYGAGPPVEVGQSQQQPVPPAVSQLQVVENHQVNPPVVLQVWLEPSTDQWMAREAKRGWLCAEQPPGDNDKARLAERCKQVRTINVNVLCALATHCCWGCFVLMKRDDK